jgi:hypothetical protein
MGWVVAGVFLAQISEACLERLDSKSAVYQEITDLYSKDMTAALKLCLQKTPFFHKVSESDLGVERLPNQGTLNSGLFKVVQLSSKAVHFVKLTPSRSEIEELWKLNFSSIHQVQNRAEKWARQGWIQNENAFHALPKIPRLEGSGLLNKEAQVYYFVQEFALGRGFAVEDFTDPESTSKFLRVGKSIGAFHFLLSENPKSSFQDIVTATHGDAHWGNILDDEDSGRTTWVDISHVKTNGSSEDVKEDLNQLVGSLFEQLPLDFLEVLSEPFPDYSDLIQLLWQTEAFIQGYLSYVPPSMRNEVQSYFQSKCLEAHKGMLNVVSLQSGSLEEKKGILHSVMTPFFYQCLEGTFNPSDDLFY